MSRLSYAPSIVSDTFQSMYRRLVDNWRQDTLVDSMFKPGLNMIDPTFNQSFNAMVRSFSNSLRLRDSMLGGMDVNLDVVEQNGAYRVRADLPGMKKEDINVRIDGNVVNIEARTQDSAESKDAEGRFLFGERYYGAVFRSFALDKELDETKATGKYADGVLTLELPKRAGASKTSVKPIAIQ